MRILICSNVYPPDFIGGAELIAHYQARILTKQGFDVAVFAGNARLPGERHSVSTDHYDGIRVHRIKLVPEDYQSEYTNFFHTGVESQFNKVLDEFRPDILHAHNIIGLSVGILHAAAIRGIKSVVTLHDFWGYCFKNTLIKRDNEVCADHTRCAECMPYVNDGGAKFPIRLRQDFMALQMRDVDAFISPSQYLAERYIKAGFPSFRMNVIWNGVDLARLSAVRKIESPGCVRFTFIGYFGGHKGLDTLLDALPMLSNREAFFLNLVGDGELRPVVEERIRAMGLKSRSKFWGKIENRRIGEVFCRTDVQILPSVWPENQPVSITEAMATRTPVIASRIGGIPELVADGRSGYLFEPGDAIGLSERMNRFIANPGLIATFGATGFESICGKSIETQVNAIRQVYDRVRQPAARDIQNHNYLILCCGGAFDPSCSDAIAELSARSDGSKYQFVNADWLAEDQFKKGQLLWVTETGVPGATVMRALRSSIPLLVREENPELRELCSSAKCGLYFRGAAEAREAILFLFEHREILAKLAKNAADAAVERSF